METKRNETSGIKNRITEAFISAKPIKLLFRYPDSNRTIVKRGHVKKVFRDSFDFWEIYDGLVTYSFNYIVEINEIKEADDGNTNT